MPHFQRGSPTVPSMAKKKPEDREIENRVRGHIRREMVSRRLGVNETTRRLRLQQGSLSKILNEQRGMSPGLLLVVQRAFAIPSVQLLEEDPEPCFMVPGVPDLPPGSKR